MQLVIVVLLLLAVLALVDASPKPLPAPKPAPKPTGGPGPAPGHVPAPAPAPGPAPAPSSHHKNSKSSCSLDGLWSFDQDDLPDQVAVKNAIFKLELDFDDSDTSFTFNFLLSKIQQENVKDGFSFAGEYAYDKDGYITLKCRSETVCKALFKRTYYTKIPVTFLDDCSTLRIDIDCDAALMYGAECSAISKVLGGGIPLKKDHSALIETLVLVAAGFCFCFCCGVIVFFNLKKR